MSPADAIGVSVADDATASMYVGAAAYAGVAKVESAAMDVARANPRLTREFFNVFSSISVVICLLIRCREIATCRSN
jgi:hypothetical protein